MRRGSDTVEQQAALIVGALLSVAVLIVYALALIDADRTDVLRSLIYNGPIAFVFLVLLADWILLAWRSSVGAVIRSFAATLTVWLIAATLLVLRFGPKPIEVSGHLTWLPMLAADAWIRRFPMWFVAFATLGTLAALYLKLAVFGGPSGVPGMLAGGALASALLWRSRAAARPGNAG
jgi:hypothetical protein